MLTGKYDNGEFPEGSRMQVNEGQGKKFHDRYFGEGKKDKTIALFANLKEIAQGMGCT